MTTEIPAEILNLNIRKLLEILRNPLVENIAFDADDVLAESIANVVNYHNYIFQNHPELAIKKEDIKNWDSMKDILKANPYLGFSEFQASIAESALFWDNPWVLKNAEPAPGAIPLLQDLRKLKKNIYVISARPPERKHLTIEWFKNRFGWEDPDKIILKSNSELPGKIFKVWAVREKNIQVIFDDSADYIPEIAKYTDCVPVLVSEREDSMQVTDPKVIKIPDLLSVHNALDKMCG